ncbi:hypothetical protein BKA57DRAFT_389578, partial [Linnemannia elongata]
MARSTCKFFFVHLSSFFYFVTTIVHLEIDRFELSLNFLNNLSVLLCANSFGGADDKYYYNDIWCFDPSNKRWEAVPAYGTLPTSRQGHTCVVIEDTMYIYGGMNHEDQLLGDLCAFKFTERRWVTIGVTEAASARTEHAMCNVGDRIYIFGGQLDLNANEDSGLIHVLETCSSSYSRPSHTTDSQRGAGHDQNSHSGDSRRGPHQQQQQQPIDRSDSYVSQQQHHQQPPQYQQQQQQQRHQNQPQQQQRQQDHHDQVYSQSDMNGSRSRLTPADDSQIGQRSPSRLSIDQSSGIRQQKSSASINAQFSHLDLNRQGSSASSVTETLNRQGSYASTATANTSQVNGRSTDSRSPLRVDLKQREQWLMAEVSMARKRIGDRPLSMAIMALEDELENCEVDSEKYRIMQALLNVKAELERSKTTIATQAQIASNKVREAERVRTSALQEAAYLKAKVSALESGEVSALVSTETARAMDLEKRLTSAMAQLDKYEAQFVQYETILEHEKHSREAAEDREREASSRAEDAQIAHTRALTELTSLHERASVAEASLRETLTTLRGLLKESQDALTVANRDLGDTMLRLSQLEQTSMTARADAATAQRQLTEHRGKVTMLQAQLIRKEEAIEEMIKEQENNEAQLGLLR